MPKRDEQTLNCDTNIEVGYNLITDWWLYWHFQALWNFAKVRCQL